MAIENRFTFQHEDVPISTQKTYTRFASKQVYDAMTFALKANEHMIQAVRWFTQLDEAENLLLEQNILLEEPKERAEQDRILRKRLIKALTEMVDQVGIVRTAKVSDAAEMERILERVTQDARKKMYGADKKVTTPSASPAPVATPTPAPTPRVASAVGARHTFAGMSKNGTKARFAAPSSQIAKPLDESPLKELPELK
jgi:hypothetical protein